METFTQPKITGYRQLNEAEAALINEIKSQGEALETLIQKLRDNQNAETREFGTPDAKHLRWIDIGEANLQQGLMALTRAVAKPTSF